MSYLKAETHWKDSVFVSLRKLCFGCDTALVLVREKKAGCGRLDDSARLGSQASLKASRRPLQLRTMVLIVGTTSVVSWVYEFFPPQNLQPFGRTDYNVYSTFQSHEPEFDYLKSVEIEEKINDISWLKRRSPAHFLLSTNGKCPLSLLGLSFGDPRTSCNGGATDKPVVRRTDHRTEVDKVF